VRGTVLALALGPWLLPMIAQSGNSPMPVQVPASSPCATASVDRDGPGPARDLYCVEMSPTARAPRAAGLLELGRIPSPFGVAVTPDGHHRHDLTLWVAGLPEPAELGEYSTYVAWVTTPYLDPVVNLGPVAEGANHLGEVSFAKFLVLVTAETTADVSERRGPLVLRGLSPANRMETHDLLTLAPSAIFPGTDPAAVADPAGADRVDTSDREAGSGRSGSGGRADWVPPPMHPAVPMLPGVAGLRPAVTPLPLEVDDLADLPEARPRELVRLVDGGTLDLEARWVRRTVGERTLAMLGFNGQYPGPLIHVPEQATISVNFTNRTRFPTSVHWHGIRLDNRFDGVPGVTQAPVLLDETFRYRIHFPDPGIYWYHPHHREDVQQELGLYGNLMVASPRADYYNPVDREEALMLDDLLLGDEGLVPFGTETSNYALMGRFGNLFLVNGEPDWQMEAARGEVVRLFLTNVSNTRTFNLSLRRRDGTAAPLKVVGTDVSKLEREEWAGSVVIAPAERYIVEARLDAAGSWTLENRVQAVNHYYGNYLPEAATLGTIRVASGAAPGEEAAPASAGSADTPATAGAGAGGSARVEAPGSAARQTFDTLRSHPDVIADIDRYRERFDDPVDEELVLTLEAEGLPEPVEQVMQFDRVFFNPVEWSGTMPMMNWVSTGEEVRWILRDPATGAENLDIDWSFEVGDVVKIRLHNARDAFHAMQHPIHIHGQRFLVLEQNGVRSANLAWKDTVLLPVGSTTDILLEISNPGRWMVHCHIAEHLESGMKLVLEAEGEPAAELGRAGPGRDGHDETGH